MYNIEVEALIPLVEARPLIWDNTLEIYKDKELRNEAWKEICTLLRDDYENMTKSEQFEFGRTALKKWTYIRDNWCRDYRKILRAKINNTILKCRPYKYRKRMSFLKKIIENEFQINDEENYESGNIEEETVVYLENYPEDSSSVKAENNVAKENKHKRRKTEYEEELEIQSPNTTFEKPNNIEEVRVKKYVDPNKPSDDNPHLHFFKSLLPFTSMLSPELMLSFQGSVINLLQDIISQRPTDVFSKLESDSDN